MNEQEQGRIDRDAGDGGDRGGDSGLVQPPESHTYRGPYGEPIVVPVADDPEGHPEYQPGHSDTAAARPADDRLDAFLATCDAFGYPVPHIGLSNADRYRDTASSSFFLPFYRGDGFPDHYDGDTGSGESDHGPSKRRDG